MRPYVMIVKDAFREAMASRVLWVLLIVITVLLVLLAPLGYREEITIGVNEGDVRELVELIDRIKTEGTREQPSPARRIWTLLDEPMQERLEDFAMPKDGDVAGSFEFVKTAEEFAIALDEVAKRPDFYDKESWEDTQWVSSEARQLIEDLDELSDDEKKRLNRLALEAAFPDLIRTSPQTSVVITYFVWDLLAPKPIRAGGLSAYVDSQVALVMKYFVGVLGIFAAVLVTAPMIPQTFDSGSINLLLSKPISRWALFLTKYFGGCAFILINAAYLIGGMWLILGIRFGMWNFRLLLAIPIYVFVFAIYYAVSASAGVLWRSTVVSVVLTVLFWFACFLVGAIKGGIEGTMLSRIRMVHLMPVQDTLIAVNEMGLSSQWDESGQEWKEVFLSDDQQQMRPMFNFMPLIALPRPVGRVYDPKGDRLLAVHRSMRTRKLVVTAGKRDEDWDSTTGVDAPPGTFSLLREPDGDILAVSTFDVFRLEGDPLGSSKPVTILGVDVPFTGLSPFGSVGPEPRIVLAPPMAAAMNGDTGMLAVYSRGVISLLGQGDAGRYELRRERELADDDERAVTLAFGGSTLVVNRSDGLILALDADSLEERSRFRPDRNSPPRFAVASPEGRWFAIVSHNGRLWMLDTKDDSLIAADVAGQGDISAAGFSGSDRLLVADRSTRVTEYQLASGEVQGRYSPKLGAVERVHRYVLSPLYAVFPKPGELDKTIQYVLSGKKTTKALGPSGDLSVRREELRPWTPVWSSLAFAVAVLALGCICVQRQQF